MNRHWPSYALLLALGCGAPQPAAPELEAQAIGLTNWVASQEYRATPSPRGLQAPNRAQGLRTYFDSEGVRVVDRTGSTPQFSLSLTGYGRDDAWTAAEAGVVTHEDAQVEITRPGVVEWYRNSAEGLEQGFTLHERPVGSGDLALELQIEGAQARANAEDLLFVTDGGRRFSFGALHVFDARGTAYPSRFDARGERFRIVVADAGAHYPLTIDPLLSAADGILLDSDQPGSLFGSAIAAAGDIDADGYADLIFGAPAYDTGSGSAGAVFVFRGSASGIAAGDTTSADAQLDSDQGLANFGASVAAAGDVDGDGYGDILIGAPNYDAGENDEGAAFVFLGGPGGIASQDASTANARLESDQPFARLGRSVASAGDVDADGYADVLVGASLYDAGESDEGAAFLFLGGPGGIANGNPASAAAQFESNQEASEFGWSVASAGDVDADGYADLIAGAYLYDAGQSNEGAVFLFLGGPAGIADGHPGTAAARLEGDQIDAFFGFSVASAGDVDADGYSDVLVGARRYDAGETDEGAAFLFYGSSAGIASASAASADVQLESDQPGAEFGVAVAGAGDLNGDGYADVVIGAPAFDPIDAAGAAFVFLGAPGGIPDQGAASAHAQLGSGQDADGLGNYVAGGGDLDGDGFDEVVAGAPLYDAAEGSGANDGGSVVFSGSALPEPGPLAGGLPALGFLAWLRRRRGPEVEDPR